MSKLLVLVAAAPLAACADTPPTPLAQMQAATVDLTTANDAKLIDPQFPAVTRLTITAGDCVRIGDDVTVDVDGVRMQLVSQGGPWNNFGESGCDDVSFELATPPGNRGTNTVLVRDSATTWTISGVDLFANDFALVGTPVAGQQARVVWQSADSIESGAYAQFQQGSTVMFTTSVDVRGGAPANAIEVPLPAGITGAGTLSINAGRTTTATRCDGPATCTLDISAGADLPLTIAAAPPNPKTAGVVAR